MLLRGVCVCSCLSVEMVVGATHTLAFSSKTWRVRPLANVPAPRPRSDARPAGFIGRARHGRRRRCGLQRRGRTQKDAYGLAQEHARGTWIFEHRNKKYANRFFNQTTRVRCVRDRGTKDKYQIQVEILQYLKILQTTYHARTKWYVRGAWFW